MVINNRPTMYNMIVQSAFIIIIICPVLGKNVEKDFAFVRRVTIL